jgi:hypothetical protein
MISTSGGLLTKVVMNSKGLQLIGTLSIVFYIIKTPRCGRHISLWPQVQTYAMDPKDRALYSKTCLQRNRMAPKFFPFKAGSIWDRYAKFGSLEFQMPGTVEFFHRRQVCVGPKFRLRLVTL